MNAFQKAGIWRVSLLLAMLWVLPVNAATQWVDLEFKAGGVVLLDHHKTSIRTDLADRLRALAQHNPPPRLRVSAAKDANYNDVAAVLTLVQKAGLKINMDGIDDGH